jgi:hypothetical protein
VLSDEPGGLCAVLSGQMISWPPVRIYDLTQPGRVAAMNFLHQWMIAIKERAIGRQFGPQAEVFLFHRHKLVAQKLVHFILFADSNERRPLVCAIVYHQGGQNRISMRNERQLSRRYSQRSAIIGSTFVARRAGR